MLDTYCGGRTGEGRGEGNIREKVKELGYKPRLCVACCI